MSTIIKAGLVLAAWSAVLVGMPFLGASGRAVAVVGDPGRAVAIVTEAGGQVIEVRGNAVLARASPAALYRAGAWLVVEGRVASGCAGAKAGA